MLSSLVNSATNVEQNFLVVPHKRKKREVVSVFFALFRMVSAYSLIIIWSLYIQDGSYTASSLIHKLHKFKNIFKNCFPLEYWLHFWVNFWHIFQKHFYPLICLFNFEKRLGASHWITLYKKTVHADTSLGTQPFSVTKRIIRFCDIKAHVDWMQFAIIIHTNTPTSTYGFDCINRATLFIRNTYI